MKVTKEYEIQNCDDCPYADIHKSLYSDSFDNVRSIYCNKLNIRIYNYLDWYDKSPIPNVCPFNKEM